jgi:hypothetical protein
MYYMFVMVKETQDLIAALQERLSSSAAKIAELEAAIQAERQLAVDTEVTLRTLRSMGVDVGPVTQAVASTVSMRSDERQAKLTIPDMILAVLGADEFRLLGAEPNRVLESILIRFDPNANPNNVRPTLWRMEQKGILEKLNGRYRIPIHRKAPDPNQLSLEGSGASDFNPAQGRQAGPGGGT